MKWKTPTLIGLGLAVIILAILLGVFIYKYEKLKDQHKS
jgi:type II secretory pathway pseudopilin PulG